MAKAHEVCTKLKAKLKDILQQEGRLAYERKKFTRDIGLEKQAVSLAMTRVTSDQKKVDKSDDRITRRADKLSLQAEGVVRDRAKVETAKKVVVFAVLFLFFYTVFYYNCLFAVSIAGSKNKDSKSRCV
jgi:hypothetical protein